MEIEYFDQFKNIEDVAVEYHTNYDKEYFTIDNTLNSMSICFKEYILDKLNQITNQG